MLERYCYEPGALYVRAFGVDCDDIEVTATEDIDGFTILDRLRGHAEDAWVLFTRDREVAEHIVQLLNASAAQLDLSQKGHRGLNA